MANSTSKSDRFNIERLVWWRTLRQARENERRKYLRKNVNLVAKFDAGRGTPLRDCMLLDISPDGARIAINSPGVPDEFTLYLTARGIPFRRCRLVWATDTEIGVQFLLVPTGTAISSAEKYRAEAVACDESAETASEPAVKQEFKELASHWHYPASQAAQPNGTVPTGSSIDLMTRSNVSLRKDDR